MAVLAYSRWHRTLGYSYFATDVDSVEVRDGQAVAVIEPSECTPSYLRCNGANDVFNRFLCETGGFQLDVAWWVGKWLGVPAFVVCVCDPDGRVIPNFITQALENKPLTVYGDGSQTRSFCYITDLIDGVYRLMRSTAHDPVNLDNPLETPIRELAKTIIEFSGSKSTIVNRPLPQDDPKTRTSGHRQSAGIARLAAPCIPSRWVTEDHCMVPDEQLRWS